MNRLAGTNTDVAIGNGGDVTTTAVQAALTRVLASDSFAASERLRRMLRFLVDEALAGRGHRLKGYRIAVEVFNRGEEFDADTDPLVRIQAGRLRRALDRYYAGDGVRDPLRISVPKGGYTPVFYATASPEPTQDASA